MVIRKLDVKLIRDLIALRGQVLAIMLVIASGVATFVMSMCAYKSLSSGKEHFYRDFRFADIFAQARRVPDFMQDRIRELPGVAAVETRLVYDVLLDLPEMNEPATARLISIPENRQLVLNQLYISRGRMLEPLRTGEVVISEVFADAHGFVAGDKVRAIINGKSQQLTIVGVALSPEYVIQVQPGSIVPDEKRFGVFWMNERDLEAALDMTGAFNSVAVKLAYGGQTQQVIDAMDDLLGPYGGIGAFDREQQLSHQYLSDELQQLQSMAAMAPSIFLSVAAFLLNMVISRIISQQREQIAALKAFGYHSYEVGMHYLNLAMVISLSGTVAGTLFGFWMSMNMTELYQKFYRFPLLEFRIDYAAVAAAFLLTTAATVVGTWLSVRGAIRLPPAEAMRPEPPPSYRPTLLERLFPKQLFTPELRMLIRNIARRPIKSTLSVLGLSMAVAVMILGSFTLDAINYMMYFQFRLAQRQDLMVNFVEPATSSVIYELASMPGVLGSETMRAVATRLRFMNRSHRVGIMGLDADPQLYRLLDQNERAVRIPEHGIMLNTKLAEILGATLGDSIIVEVLEEDRPTFVVQVTGLVEEYAGANAYMRKSSLHALLKESAVASGAFLKVDPNRIQQVFEQLESRPGVASVAIKNAVIRSFEETVAENILIMRTFIASFAAAIAVGVVYNSARISLSEKSRDLATMRVMGFSRGEVTLILLGEIAVFTLIAIPVGWLLGYGFAAYMIAGLDTENYRIPLVIERQTFAMAAVVVLLATFGSGLIVQRQIRRLDLVGVLKTRD